jgi:hypothetical protein
MPKFLREKKYGLQIIGEKMSANTMLKFWCKVYLYKCILNTTLPTINEGLVLFMLL